MSKPAAQPVLTAVPPTPVVIDSAATWHGILYGDAGIGKSHCFSSFAAPDRPCVVASFDARGKDIPYHLRGRGGTLLPDEFEDKLGTRYKEVRDEKTNALLWRIEYYHDPKYDEPDAAGRFRERVNRCAADFEKGRFWGFFLDSATSASLRFRKYHQYVDNPKARNSMHWFGGETDDMENFLQLHLPGLPGTVGVAMHVSKTTVEAEGIMVRAPWIRGRNFEQLATQWPEIYRVYVDKDGERKVRRFQTENDEKWLATTVLGVPDGAVAHWRSIAKALA